jgi:hypothetical protein
MKKIWNSIVKDKVLISSLVTSLILLLQQITQEGQTDLKAIGMAALLVILGVLGRHWKGAGLSLLGILGAAITAFVQVWNTGEFSWDTFVPMAALAILTTFAPTATPEKKEEDKPPFPYNAGGR